MSDMISRQTAISAICNACGKIDCDKMDKCEKLQLPPANSSEFPNSSDTISRQAAIEALNGNITVTGEENAKAVQKYIRSVSLKIHDLPSTQPEPKPISYMDCANAMLKMWIDNVLTDGEYNRIMDKLNSKHMADMRGEEE